MSDRPNRVFFLGAGASKSCGIPLASELLKQVFAESDLRNGKRINELIRYLYPSFEPAWGNYPGIEEFLSLLDVVVHFSDTVKKKHKFPPDEIKGLRDDLLRAIAALMYRKKRSNGGTPLFDLAKSILPSDTVVTLNWDLLLERALVRAGIRDWSYVSGESKPTILKPHGSIDWFDSEEIKFANKLTFPLISKFGAIRIFKNFSSSNLNKTVPVIIPPTLSKKWKHEEFNTLWRHTWRALRDAREVYVLGFSLPPEDLHIRFIIRSAIRASEKISNLQKFTLVNPDRSTFLRFTNLLKTPIKYYECPLERVSINEMLSNRTKK
jgi:hypothetical protein